MKKKSNALNQSVTEWRGERYFFEGGALSPDDPEFKRRERRGPNSPQALAKKRGGKKPKK